MTCSKRTKSWRPFFSGSSGRRTIRGSSDGTGTTYADVTMRDVYAFAGAFMTDATAFSRSTEAGSMDEAAMKAKLGELFNAAMEKTTDTTESYIGVDLVKQGDAWVVDEESWSDETELLFGNL